jgi:hypothetical protein
MATRSGGFGWFLRTHYEIHDDRVVITSPTRRWWALIALAPIGAVAVLVAFFASSPPIFLGGAGALMLGASVPAIVGMPPPGRVECSAEGVRGSTMIGAHEIEEIELRDHHFKSSRDLFERHDWKLEVKQEYLPRRELVLAHASVRNLLVEPEARALGEASVALVRRPAVTAP